MRCVPKGGDSRICVFVCVLCACVFNMDVLVVSTVVTS